MPPKMLSLLLVESSAKNFARQNWPETFLGIISFFKLESLTLLTAPYVEELMVVQKKKKKKELSQEKPVKVGWISMPNFAFPR